MEETNVSPEASETPAPEEAEASTYEETIVEAAPAEAAATSGLPVPLVAPMVVALLLSLVLVRVSRLRILEKMARWFPLMHVLIWAVAWLVSATIAAYTLSTEWLLLDTLILALVVFIAQGWIRSVFAGVALGLERRVKFGDWLRVGEVEGEVMGLGLRSVSIRAEDGTVHDIPNERFITESVSNLSGGSGDSACDLYVPVPEGLPSQEALEIARNAAIVSPLASPRHKPQVFLIPPSEPGGALQLRVHGYAFDASYQEHFRSDVLHRMLQAFEERGPTFLAEQDRIATSSLELL